MRGTWSFVLVTGCGTATGSFGQELDATGVARLDARVPLGDLSVAGDDEDVLTVTGDLTAEGRRAQRRLDEASVSAEVVLDTLRLAGPAADREVRAELTVSGPSALSVAAAVPDGVVRLDGLTGDHEVEAARVEVAGGAGDRRLVASRGGATLAGDPVPGDTWVLDVTGDLELSFPRDAEVRLEAVLSEGARAEVTGLLFDEWFGTDDYLRGQVGSGAVDVRIDLRQGTLRLYGHDPE